MKIFLGGFVAALAAIHVTIWLGILLFLAAIVLEKV